MRSGSQRRHEDVETEFVAFERPRVARVLERITADLDTLLLTKEGRREFPAVPVEVADTTGAGGAFTAPLAVALAEGKDIATAIRFASCSGALACTRLGVISALRYRTEVDKLFDRYFTH